MSLSPQPDLIADQKDTSISTSSEHTDNVVSKAPVASSADEPTTEVEELEQGVDVQGAAVAKDDSSNSEAPVAQGDQAHVTGNKNHHDDVDMAEAHAKKPTDTEVTTRRPSPYNL
jgi:hypothetical protein